jgi:predicted DNA-binding protein
MTTRDPRPRDAVVIRLELSAADRNRLLVAAARAGKSMASHVREVIVNYLDDLDPPAPRRKPTGKDHKA